MPWVVPVIAAAGAIGSAAIQANAAKKQRSALSGIGNEMRATNVSTLNSERVFNPSTGKYDLAYSPGYAAIDPNIRNLRLATLKNLPGYRDTLTSSYGNLNSNLGDIRNSLASNTNPFIQARVNPLLEQGARRRGELTQGLTRRGIFGPLYNQTMNTFEGDLSRQEGDQRALATQEQLSGLLGIDTQRYNAALSSVQSLQGLDQQQQSVAAQELAQELAALGLTQADTGAILGAAGLNLQQQQLQQANLGRGLYALGAGLEGMSGSSGQYNTGWDSSWGDIGL